jgi:hypothetical protein
MGMRQIKLRTLAKMLNTKASKYQPLAFSCIWSKNNFLAFYRQDIIAHHSRVDILPIAAEPQLFVLSIKLSA